MSKPVWTRLEIESPCVQVCVVDPQSRLCLGCYRSIDEIKDWSVMEPRARRKIMDALASRKDLVKPKRKGGRSRNAQPPKL